MTTADPWPKGARVRVTKPDEIRKAATAGMEGVVESSKHYPADRGRDAIWLVWVQFGSPATWDDWRERGKTNDVRGLFCRELERIA